MTPGTNKIFKLTRDSLKRCLVLLVLPLLLLTACNVIPALPGLSRAPAQLTPTEDCGCTLKTPLATPTGGLLPAGPAAPAPQTPTPASLESFRDQWQSASFQGAGYAFAFDYPAAYTSPDYNFCAVRQPASPAAGVLAAINLGSNTQVSLLKTSQSLEQVAAAFRGDPQNQDLRFEDPQARTVGGVPAVSLPYRSGGANRSAETTFFIKDSILYRIDSSAPSACDIPALNLTEMNAYGHLLESFQFK